MLQKLIRSEFVVLFWKASYQNMLVKYIEKGEVKGKNKIDLQCFVVSR